MMTSFLGPTGQPMETTHFRKMTLHLPNIPSCLDNMTRTVFTNLFARRYASAEFRMVHAERVMRTH